MKDASSYFPTGIVTGKAFCNRKKERRQLKQCLEQNAHVVIMSPRRYGKSSLIGQFTREQKLPFVAIDLLAATSSKYVKNAITDGVTQLLNHIMPRLKKPKAKILGYFSTMNPVIELSAFGQNVKLKPDERTNEEAIIKLLMNLDKAAREVKKKLIFVMDEFQQIAHLEGSHSLEASIRHAVERSKHVFYIFSGSNRTLLKEMFTDENRPLYYLCDEMRLNRISKDDYSSFLAKAAHEKWGKNVSVGFVNEIMDLTECHPYYVNRLCRILWTGASAPQKKGVRATWERYVEVQRMDWVSDRIALLTVNQRAVLTGIAKLPEKEPMSKNFTNRLEISASSVQRALNSLRKEDLIYKSENDYYKVLNPVIKWVLAKDCYYEL